MWRLRQAPSGAPKSWCGGEALQILHKELDVTMAFCGHTQLKNVDRGILRPGTF